MRQWQQLTPKPQHLCLPATDSRTVRVCQKLAWKCGRPKTGKGYTSNAEAVLTASYNLKAFKENVKRAHYQACLWRSLEVADPPVVDMEQYGWKKTNLQNRSFRPQCQRMCLLHLLQSCRLSGVDARVIHLVVQLDVAAIEHIYLAPCSAHVMRLGVFNIHTWVAHTRAQWHQVPISALLKGPRMNSLMMNWL